MQKILLSIALMFSFSFLALAGNAPEAAEKAFSAKFPKAENVKWGKESANNYEAEFVLGGVKMSANFNGDGKWLETETTIAVKELPKGVTDYISKNFPKAKINEASKIERPTMDAVLYEAEIKDNGKETDLLLTFDGKLVK